MPQEMVVCVVGLSNNKKEKYSTRPGVGKSCLCFRFAYPGHDNYISSHPSILALHEFESPVINSAHFLYWGSPVKSYPVKGGEVSIVYHVIEHTVFYQDVTSSPFNPATIPDSVSQYTKRITGPIESPGKHSYYSRDDILQSECYKKFYYPKGLTKLERGFVVVFDVSLSGINLDMQYQRVEPILEYLSKHKKKFVIAVTKRDHYQAAALELAYTLRKKFRSHLVETSSHEYLNVDEVFRILAQHVLTKKLHSLSNQVLQYHEAAQRNLMLRNSAKRSFMSFIKKRISCDDKLTSIIHSEPYRDCVLWIGSEQTGRLYAQNTLELYKQKVLTYAGVTCDKEMHKEFLEDFVDQRYDLKAYLTEMRG